MNLTVLTCNYNTPDLILNLKRSFDKNSKLACNFFIVNTSTEDESQKVLAYNNLNFVNLKGAVHGHGVNYGLKQIKTKYVLLVDSDVIIIDNLQPLYEKFVSSGVVLAGRVVGNEGGKLLYPRVDPSFCFIDLQQINKHNITFFDEERTRKSKITSRVYNIGSTMYEDVKLSGLTIGDMDFRDIKYIHYEGMSWRVQSYNPSKSDTDIDFGGTHPDEQLKTYGELVRVKYENDIKKHFK
jgi:hypothetical protein